MFSLASGRVKAINFSKLKNEKELQDNARIAQDCSKVGHWKTEETCFEVHSVDEVPYAGVLIKQAFEKRRR